MSIQSKEIQPADRDLRGIHVWLILVKAFHAIAACNVKSLEGTGLGESDFRVLEVLLHKGALPVNTIGPKVFLTTGSISTAVERLHSKGLVTRSPGEKDRRVHIVDLTPSGRALIKRVFAANAKMLEEIAEVLSPAERVHLIDTLKKLGKNAGERLLT
jgi:MarR family 2-MHQ and catechol resistance regulon transcriptional repressor